MHTNYNFLIFSYIFIKFNFHHNSLESIKLIYTYFNACTHKTMMLNCIRSCVVVEIVLV